jgi:hypothetical protein
LNFFTVRDWTPVDVPNAEPRRGSYTSIYKVHEGKWYEQLRGIFANSEQPPNAFLIYDRIED